MGTGASMRGPDESQRCRRNARQLQTLGVSTLPSSPTGSSRAKYCSNELDSIVEARRLWEEGICEEVNALAEEQGRPMARLRTAATIAHDEKRREAMSEVEQQASRRFLFDGEDLLEAILQIECPNRRRKHAGAYSWGIIKVMLKTPDLRELRSTFHELGPMFRQMGVDESIHRGGDAWATARLKQGKSMSASGFVGVMQQYARRGIPPSLRPDMWRKILGLGERTTAGDAPP